MKVETKNGRARDLGASVHIFFDGAHSAASRLAAVLILSALIFPKIKIHREAAPSSPALPTNAVTSVKVNSHSR